MKSSLLRREKCGEAFRMPEIGLILLVDHMPGLAAFVKPLPRSGAKQALEMPPIQAKYSKQNEAISYEIYHALINGGLYDLRSVTEKRTG